MCLRDRAHIASTYASIDEVALDPTDRDLLFARFPIYAGAPSLVVNSGEGGGTMEISVLFGHPEQPYLRIDPYFMPDPTDDRAASDALGRLIETLDWAQVAVPLAPGEIILVDNYRAVHGRQGFRPRFDGTDRWLKGLNIVRTCGSRGPCGALPRPVLFAGYLNTLWR